MAYFTPLYDGNPIFGLAVRMQMVPNPTQLQLDSFFGVNGVVSLFGGSRGRTFMIQGCLFAFQDAFSDPITIIDLNAAEGVIHSFADGIARTMVDTRGNSWPNVVFRDEFQPDPMGARPSDSGWILPYRMVMHGLT
jgi:hypothetical protein